jgi:hypothetical protein
MVILRSVNVNIYNYKFYKFKQHIITILLVVVGTAIIIGIIAMVAVDAVIDLSVWREVLVIGYIFMM